MKLRNLIKYVQYSGIWIGFVLNPFHWEFKMVIVKPTEMDPKQYGFSINFGPMWIRMVIDNGTY